MFWWLKTSLNAKKAVKMSVFKLPADISFSWRMKMKKKVWEKKAKRIAFRLSLCSGLTDISGASIRCLLIAQRGLTLVADFSSATSPGCFDPWVSSLVPTLGRGFSFTLNFPLRDFLDMLNYHHLWKLPRFCLISRFFCPSFWLARFCCNRRAPAPAVLLVKTLIGVRLSIPVAAPKKPCSSSPSSPPLFLSYRLSFLWSFNFLSLFIIN